MVNKKIESYIREYPLTYVNIDVNGKTVLDIGADVGTSAEWFIKQGAKRVICFSLEEQEIFDERIEWHGKWNGEYVKADVLKIDCEGCECLLTQEVIEKYSEYYIAIHTFAQCFLKLKEYLQKNANIIFITPDKKEEMYISKFGIIEKVE